MVLSVGDLCQKLSVCQNIREALVSSIRETLTDLVVHLII